MIVAFLRFFFLLYHQSFHNTTKLSFQETLWKSQKWRDAEKHEFLVSCSTWNSSTQEYLIDTSPFYSMLTTSEQPVHHSLDNITVTDHILIADEKLQLSVWEEVAELIMS